MRRAGTLIALPVLLAGTFGAQSPSVDWTHYGGNAASQKYSPLDQINQDNVGKLKIAWRWTSPDNAVVTNLPKAFEFLAGQRKAATAAQQQ